MRKTNLPSLFGALLLGLSSTAATAADTAVPTVEAGQWEISVTMTMNGTATPPSTVQQCFTDSDVADTKQLLPSGGSCTVSNYQLSGNSATWNIECGGGVPMTGSGNATFSSTSFSGTLNMTLGTGGAETVRMTQSFTAHRTGSCHK